jgi:non-ribosomal peptide synthetase component E (peptide arylation enzyme)
MTHPSFPPFAAEFAQTYRSSGFWTPETFVTALDNSAKRAPDKPVIEEWNGKVCSYGELKDRSTRLANAFLRLGLRNGDVIAIQLPSCTEFLTAYIAATRIGAILATMHMPYRENELEPLLRFCEAKAVICGVAAGSYEGPPMMRRLQAKIAHISHVIVVGQGPVEASVHRFDDLIAASDASPIAHGPKASEPALLCFTSGTSSSPKGVMHGFETLTANARAYSKTIHLSSDDKALIAPPFTHIFGLECFHNTLVTGGTVIPLAQYNPQTFAEMLEATQPTVIYAAPAHLAGALKSGNLGARKLDSVRQVILGGSICPPQVAADFESHLPNGRVGNLFGMTEVLLTTQTPMDQNAFVRHSTIGRPVPGISARIMSEEGREVLPGEIGELQMRGFSIMSGYMKNPEANASSFTEDGWFRTGDLACWDNGENIIIVGRKKDLINRGGVKINPTDIENIIMEHESVVQAALVSMEDDVLGERICAFVTLVSGAKLNLDELCGFLAEKGVAKMRWPERVVVIDEMPMTPTRKIIKGALQQQLRQAG